MFSFFKKKPKPSNPPLEDLALMLWQEETNPTYMRESLVVEKLDFSVESLVHIDGYLEKIHKQPPADDEVVQIALRTGAYLGEVIRKNSTETYNWLDFKEATKINDLVKQLGMQIGTAAVLWSEPDNLMFPIAKIIKYIENGSEDSVHFFAQVAIKGVKN